LQFQAKEDLRVLFEALPQERRDAIIDPKAANKLPHKELNKPHTSQSAEPGAENDKGTPQSSKKRGKNLVGEMENNNVWFFPYNMWT
jgi:chromatin assembly factor 1 subunit A